MRVVALRADEPHLAQALWSFAHGMVILEIDGRYPQDPQDSGLDKTWEAGAAAFGRMASAVGAPFATLPAIRFRAVPAAA